VYRLASSLGWRRLARTAVPPAPDGAPYRQVPRNTTTRGGCRRQRLQLGGRSA